MTLLLLWATGGGLMAADEATLAPDITAETWLNAEPLRIADLRGSVVLVEFWTFGCWNCRNVEPYIKAWHDRYADQGLVVLAVHTPEFAYEKETANVRAYLKDHDIRHAVAIDNDFSTWRAFGNRAWPSIYLIDKQGRIRYRHIGEGAYRETEAAIRALLAEPAQYAAR
jgi:thiol-disulfide isomerase/thioredoxin